MNPEYVNSLVTFLVGGVALLVYWLTKRQERANAAAIIVMDIRHAEQVVSSILERATIDRTVRPILHENNWVKYNHLFASELSYDDLLALNRFFDACVEIADARRRMNEVFYAAVNAKAALLQERILEIEDLASPEGSARKAQLVEKFNTEGTHFDPIDPRSVITQNLQLMGRPSGTIAFAKLKRIARIEA